MASGVWLPFASGTEPDLASLVVLYLTHTGRTPVVCRQFELSQSSSSSLVGNQRGKIRFWRSRHT